MDWIMSVLSYVCIIIATPIFVNTIFVYFLFYLIIMFK